MWPAIDPDVARTEKWIGTGRPAGPDLIAPSRLRREPADERQPPVRPLSGRDSVLRSRVHKTGMRTARWTPRLVFLRLSVTSRRSHGEYDARPLPSRRYTHSTLTAGLRNAHNIACVRAIGSPLAYIFVYAFVLRSSEVFARARDDLERESPDERDGNVHLASAREIHSVERFVDIYK